MRTVSSVLAVSFLSVFAVTSAIAVPSHIWSHRYGSTGFDIGYAVTTDDDNVIATGYFNGTVDFGAGNLTSAGGADVFLVKLDETGAHVWSKRLGGTGTDVGYAVAADVAGSVYVAGGFEGTVNFGGGDLTSAGGADIFIAKFDVNGAYLWSKRFGSTLGDYAFGLEVYISDVMVTGVFRGTVDFGGGGLVSAGFDDIYVATFDGIGTHQWSARNGGTMFDRANAICRDGAGNIFLAGQFQGTVSGQVASGTNAFLTKYSPTGTFQWFLGFGGTGSDIGKGVITDDVDDVYLIGYFNDTASFGGTPLVSAGGSDIVLAKYDNSGAHQWSKRFGDTANDEGHGVAIQTIFDEEAEEEFENVVITGEFRGTVDFGGGAFVAGASDVFVALYDLDGLHQWSEQFGDNLEDAGNSVMSRSGNVIVTGAFRGTVDFGGGGLTSSGETDVFVVKYGETVTGVGDTPGQRGVSVSSHPNPFNPTTTVSYTVPAAGPVTVAIYDAAGARVATLVNSGKRAPGAYQVDWEGRTDAGGRAPSGVYFARVEQGGVIATAKLVLLK
jgi:hypothetical protein